MNRKQMTDFVLKALQRTIDVREGEVKVKLEERVQQAIHTLDSEVNSVEAIRAMRVLKEELADAAQLLEANAFLLEQIDGVSVVPRELVERIHRALTRAYAQANSQDIFAIGCSELAAELHACTGVDSTRPQTGALNEVLSEVKG
jgi:hypothetical protein